MADVFISYHEQSAGDIAAKIADALEEAGISCWYAKRDIPPGGDFARYIPPQIDACKVFLLILNDSVVHQSNHIENELGLAFGRLNRKEEITILPLEIGEFKRETWIRYYLVHTQSVKIPLLDNTQAQEVTRKIANILGKHFLIHDNELSTPSQMITKNAQKQESESSNKDDDYWGSLFNIFRDRQ